MHSIVNEIFCTNACGAAQDAVVSSQKFILQNQSSLLVMKTLYIHTHIHTYIHTNIDRYIHTYIHTYILTYIHTYIQINNVTFHPHTKAAANIIKNHTYKNPI